MAEMRRTLFKLAACLSAGLCLLVLGAWVFSLFASYGQVWNARWGASISEERNRAWVADRGTLHLLRRDRVLTPSATGKRYPIYFGGYDPAGRMGLVVGPTRWGFANVNKTSTFYERAWNGPTIGVTDLSSQWSFPLWLLAMVLAILPAAWLLVRWYGQRRQIGGRCLHCGYD